MDATGRDQLFAWAGPATLACSAPSKGRAIRCTVLGFTSNLAAVLRTLMPPARAARIHSATLPRRLPSRLARCKPARTCSWISEALEIRWLLETKGREDFDTEVARKDAHAE